MPPTRGRPIALKLLILLLVPLLSLVGLWVFAAALTGGVGLRLLAINDLANNLATPSGVVTTELQYERLASVEYLVSGQGADKLSRQRDETDRAVATFRRLAGSQRNLSPAMTEQLATVNHRIDQLVEVRRAVDGLTVPPLDVIDSYSQVVDASFRMYDAMVLVPDLALYQQARAVTTLGEAMDMLSRERAMIAVVLARGRVESRERETFTSMVATRRLLYSQAVSHLDEGLRGPWDRLTESPVYREFLKAEDAIRGQAATNGLPAAAATWPVDGQNLWTAVEREQARSTENIVRRVTPAAAGLLIKIGVAGGLGLIAVVASIMLSLRFRKRLVRELAALRDAATELAEVRLAGLVSRLRMNVHPPTAAETAPVRVEARTSEVQDIVRAFNDVQSTAIEAAVGQARLRHGVSQVFVNLARRNQSLLHRQLLQLDSMERATEEPGILADLFKLDHLTTRMRRHAESLIILSDQVPGRSWRNPVPILDVMRAAVAEVEEYERVEVLQPPPVALVGVAVTDVAHLLAELVENATLFSPPQTRVDLRSSTTPHGLMVEIEDRGLGLPRQELDALNDRLSQTPEFDLAQSDQLGLFVVSRLAARHGIKVTLAASPYGGLTAMVALPQSLLADQPALSGR
ncbi:sensor histidine kinase [Nonomuraea jiangxiensis]|uniref:histidine kinase n=1 Tax=Nonomuraea jiangxiensis TaxID=633440 RepID=A0A1G9HAY4_9ACTN|nr:nitrate- and nitrite sensing domain-containing protein [Nonomuraea jiangxiensis]SDL10067.1 Signal transduction histidine kinase [Nonomuraea jiangxiensis]